MAYDRLGYPMGGYPRGSELGEDGPVLLGGGGGMRPPGGAYGRQGFGVPGYVDDAYERGRPLGGEYVGGAADYYGASERMPGGYGYGRERYASSGYGRGYPPEPEMVIPGAVEILEPELSDLGMGLRDARKVDRRHPADYGAGFGRPDLAGAGYGGAASGYGRRDLGGGGYGGAPGYPMSDLGGGGYGGAPGYPKSDLGGGYGGAVPGYERPDIAAAGYGGMPGYPKSDLGAGYGGMPGYGKGAFGDDKGDDDDGGKDKEKKGRLHRLFHGGGGDDSD